MVDDYNESLTEVRVWPVGAVFVKTDNFGFRLTMQVSPCETITAQSLNSLAITKIFFACKSFTLIQIALLSLYRFC